MTLKERLIALLEWTDGEVERWLDGLGADERAAAGRVDGWAARDLLAHLAEWDGVQAGQFADTLAGRESPTLPDDDTVNAQFFERNRALAWDELAAKAAANRAAMLAGLRALPDATVEAPPGPDTRPVQSDVLYGKVYHTLRHLSENMIARGEREAADALMEEGARRMAAIDDAPVFQGTVQYNLACHYALNDQPQRALSVLAGALAARPEMAEYAAQDPDFATLRDDPAFRELLNTKTV